MKRKEALLTAMHRELDLRKGQLHDPVESIYFGGGTPSVLEIHEIKAFLEQAGASFDLAKDLEVTLEANPDDLNKEKLTGLKEIGINRLSLGIQSFFDEDLVFMNRAHDSSQAIQALEMSFQYFQNVSIDLIYGLPGMNPERWVQNMEKAFNYPIKHLSSYALTVEPRTVLHHRIETGQCLPLSEELASSHFELLVIEAEKRGFVHYEISNFGKENWFSRHNTSYWKGAHYLGIGPSAHSFLGNSRSWNVSNNARYIKSLEAGTVPSEKEVLTPTDRANEMIMTGLRTIWGVSLSDLESELNSREMARLKKRAEKYLDRDLLKIDSGHLKVGKKGLFLVDGIASDLFIV